MPVPATVSAEGSQGLQPIPPLTGLLFDLKEGIIEQESTSAASYGMKGGDSLWNGTRAL
jgi:hypothetical protein